MSSGSTGTASAPSHSVIVSSHAYPLYSCSLSRRGHLLLAGGGGKGNYGVPNTLVRCQPAGWRWPCGGSLLRSCCDIFCAVATLPRVLVLLLLLVLLLSLLLLLRLLWDSTFRPW